MAVTLGATISRTLYLLGDTAGVVWKRDEIATLLVEALEQFCHLTRAIWGRELLDDVAGQAVYDLPEDFLEIERATWDNKRLDPFSSREIMRMDSEFLELQGDPTHYIMDMDGLNKFRKYPIPTVTQTSERAPVYTEDFAPLPDGTISNVDRCRLLSVEFARYGERTSRNTIVEYVKRLAMNTTNEGQEFELPDRYVKYLRWYVMWKGLEHDGPGQDLELAEHFKARWDIGINRVLRRKRRLMSRRTTILGAGTGIGATTAPQRGARPKLPWNYPSGR